MASQRVPIMLLALLGSVAAMGFLDELAPKAVAPRRAVSPVAPVAAVVAAPQPAAVVEAENPNAAFVQLRELQTEFEQISANDQAHMRKLLFNVQLRDVLKKKLQAELQHLEEDNSFLQGAIVRVKEMEAAERSGTAVTPMTSQALLSLKKELSAAPGKSSEVIAHEVLQHIQAMSGAVAQVRLNDEHEIASLVANSQARSKLEHTIEEQKAKLDADSGVLLKDLSQIATLATIPAAIPAAHAHTQAVPARRAAVPARQPVVAVQQQEVLPPLPPLPPVDDNAAIENDEQ